MSQDPTHDLQVRRLTWEADQVVSVVLAAPDGRPLAAWEPGAHVDLCLPNEITRQFSLCGEPTDLGHYRIAVLREQISRGGSQYVHEMLRPGQLVAVTEPRNNFAFERAERYLFIAGGIGITPLLPMVHAAARADAEWRLLYGGRRRASMAFLHELEQYGEHVVVRPEDEFGLLPLGDWLGEPRSDTKVYCCGPEPLLKAVEELCAAWPVGALSTERFAPKPAEDFGPVSAATFDVVCKRAGVRVTVPPGSSILETVRAAGVDVPSSCEDGICGTCESAILDGVADHRDSILSSAEQAAGLTMMICVSRARSDVLVLDI